MSHPPAEQQPTGAGRPGPGGRVRSVLAAILLILILCSLKIAQRFVQTHLRDRPGSTAPAPISTIPIAPYSDSKAACDLLAEPLDAGKLRDSSLPEEIEQRTRGTLPDVRYHAERLVQSAEQARAARGSPSEGRSMADLSAAGHAFQQACAIAARAGHGGTPPSPRPSG